MNDHKHLTLEDRQTIAAGLNTRCSFKTIGRVIHKDCTTVAREVKRNLSVVKSGCWGHGYNNCAYSFTCSKTHVCTECKNTRFIKKCRLCRKTQLMKQNRTIKIMKKTPLKKVL